MDHPTLDPKFRNKNIQPNLILLNDLPKQLYNIKHDATIYYVHVPQYGNPSIGLNLVREHFKITETLKIEIDGYQIDVYRLLPL
jgi:hypothetical protein